MNKTYIFKSLKKNTEQRQKQISTQNNDCYNTRDLKTVQLLVPYSDTSTTISISLTSFYSTCTNLILVWLLVLIKQILTWSEVWLAVSGTRVRMDLWCLISLFQMKRLKRQEMKQNDTVFHCLLRNAQINTIIVQHIRTKTIQSLTYVLTNSNSTIVNGSLLALIMVNNFTDTGRPLSRISNTFCLFTRCFYSHVQSKRIIKQGHKSWHKV